MEISWFEIIAQIINFFILLFILQKLLYKPVVKAMTIRQEKIQKAQIESEEKMNEAKGLITEYNSKIADVDNEKREILTIAKKQAQEKKDSLLKDYQSEAEAKRKAYLKEIEDEKEEFLNSLNKNLGSSAVKIAAHILSTISSKEIENEVFKNFVDTIKNLHENISDSKVLEGGKDLKIQSSRKLNQKEKDIIEKTIKKQIKDFEKIDYEIDESLIIGHELDLETYTIHTNIKNYLQKIKQDIIKNLNANAN